MHLALAASHYFADAAWCESELHSETCDSDLRQLPLAGIASKRAHGPERIGRVDPSGLWCFLHLGLDVWVDLRGRRRQLSARHGSLPFPSATSSRERPICFLLRVSEQAASHSATDATRAKPHPSSHWCCAKAEGDCLPTWRITGSSVTLRRASACLLDVERSSIPDGAARSPCVFEIHASSRSNVSRSANPTGSPTGYITDDGQM